MNGFVAAEGATFISPTARRDRYLNVSADGTIRTALTFSL